MMNRQNDKTFATKGQAVFICQKCSNCFIAEIDAVLDGEDCPVCEGIPTVQDVETGYYYRSSPGLE